MTDPVANPAQAFGARVADLQGKIGALRNDAELPDMQEALAVIDTTYVYLASRLVTIRGGSVPVDSTVEERLRAQAEKWTAERPSALKHVTDAAMELAEQVDQLQPMLAGAAAMAANIDAATPLLVAAEAKHDGVTAAIEEARGKIRTQLAPFTDGQSALSSELGGLEQTASAFASATFTLNSGERACRAVETELAKGDPRGALFLTTHRLIFEGSHAGASRSVLVEEDLRGLGAVRGAKEGFFGNEDHLYVAHSPSGGPELHFHLYGQDSYRWADALQQRIAAAK